MNRSLLIIFIFLLEFSWALTPQEQNRQRIEELMRNMEIEEYERLPPSRSFPPYAYPPGFYPPDYYPPIYDPEYGYWDPQPPSEDISVPTETTKPPASNLNTPSQGYWQWIPEEKREQIKAPEQPPILPIQPEVTYFPDDVTIAVTGMNGDPAIITITEKNIPTSISVGIADFGSIISIPLSDSTRICMKLGIQEQPPGEVPADCPTPGQWHWIAKTENLRGYWLWVPIA